VGGEVNGGGPRHKKHAQLGAFFVGFMLWEVGVVPANGCVFCVFHVLKRRRGEGDSVC